LNKERKKSEKRERKGKIQKEGNFKGGVDKERQPISLPSPQKK